jgi:hypothetical protein
MCRASHLVLGQGRHVPWQPRSLIGQRDAVGNSLLLGDSFGVVWFGSPCSLLVVPTRCVTLEVTNQHDTRVFAPFTSDVTLCASATARMHACSNACL